MTCSTRLKGYLEFKAKFLQGQACVQSFRTEQRGGLLRHTQVYLRNESEVSCIDLVVCRFCLEQATGAYIALVEDQKELILVTIMMGNCFPGLALGTISGCVICVPCHEALETSYNFITSLGRENFINKDDTVVKMEFDEGGIKVEDNLLTANGGAEFDGEVPTTVNGGFEQVDEWKPEEKYNGGRNQDEYDGSETRDVGIKEEDVVIEEHSLSSFEDDTCDIKVEPSVNEVYYNDTFIM